MATLNRTFSVKNGIDVANTIIVDGSRNLLNIASANASTVNAETFVTTAGLNVTDQANNARLQANTARDAANGAYAQANGAYGQANGAYGQANGAYAQANTGIETANGAYAQANGAYGQANGAYGQANIAYSQANSAYGEANLKLNLTGGTISGNLIITGNLEVLGNSTTLNVETLSVEDNEIILNSNATGSPVLDAFITINRGSSANAILKWDESSDQWKWGDGDNTFYAFDAALDAYASANLAYSGANAAVSTANDAYAQANSAREQANTARTTANDAYGAANTRVLKSGDTMTGVLTITNSGFGLAVGNAAVTYELSIGSLNVSTNTVTTSATGQVVLDTFATTEHASAKYFVQVKNGSNYHTTEIVLVQDATNVWITEYGIIQTGASLGSFSADISSGDVRLLFNADNAVNTIRAVRYGVAPP